jgi:hypothetical protein
MKVKRQTAVNDLVVITDEALGTATAAQLALSG